MKYYQIRKASDPKIIGVKDGLSQVEINRDSFIDKSQYDKLMELIIIPNYWEKEGYSAHTIFSNIEHGVMRKGAKLNDFMGFRPYIVGCSFIISDKAKSTLERFEMGEHNFFPIKIYKDNVVQHEHCYMLHTPILDFDIVDFTRTSFYAGNAILGGKKYVEIKNKEDLLRNPFVHVEKGILTNRFDKTRDFFFSKVDGVFVSEPLMEEIVTQGLDGLIFPREKGAIFAYPE